jgi:tetratricopeptide (TPR) repeat protein
MKKNLLFLLVFCLSVWPLGKAQSQPDVPARSMEPPTGTLAPMKGVVPAEKMTSDFVDPQYTRTLIQSGDKERLSTHIDSTKLKAETVEKKALISIAYANELSRAAMTAQKDNAFLQEEAVALYKEALPNLTGVVRLQTANNYGTILLRQDKPQKALEVLQPLEQEYTQSNDTAGKTAYFYNLGRAYEKSAELTKAKKSYQQAALTDPGFSPASRAVNRLLPKVAKNDEVLAGTAEWLNAVIDKGDLAQAEKNLQSVLANEELYRLPGFEKILISLIRYLALVESDVDQFRERWEHRLPPLGTLQPTAQRVTLELKSLYHGDLEIEFKPESGLRYVNTIFHESRKSGMADLATRFVKMVGDRYRAARFPAWALQRYAIAWSLDTTNMEAAYGAVNVLFENVDLLPGATDQLDRFIHEVFELKGQAYKAPVGEDWENILRFHLVLGSIYTKKEIWGNSYNARSAIFQLEHALHVHSRLAAAKRDEVAGPIAGVQFALGGSYEKTGDKREAGAMYLKAAESAVAEKDTPYAKEIIAKMETDIDRYDFDRAELERIEQVREQVTTPKAPKAPGALKIIP